MSLKKFVVNGLAVVGAVVVADKIVTAVCNKSTKAISEELLKKFSHDGHCCENSECDEECDDFEKENDSTSEEDSLSDDVSNEAEDDDTDKDGSDNNTYEFTVKAENITSDPKEV